MPGKMETDLVGEMEPKLYEAIVQFSSSINNRKIEGSYNIASATVSLLKHVINGPEFVNSTELLFSCRKFGCELIRALPQETIVGNMVRRVLRIIREEYNMAGKSSEAAGGAEASGASLQKLVRAAARRSLHSDTLPDLREAVLEHITEFQAELETSVDNIAAQAVEHIHANELIFTLGASRLVEKFLLQAAKKRTFHVIVAEGNEPEQGHKMAANLGRAGIETTLISSGACMGVMSRVNKVIGGTRAVLASGGLRAQTGFETVALAARHYRVPVIILSPLYKLCPLHDCTYEEYNFNALRNPEAALPYKTGAVVHKSRVYSPQYDYVDPDAVTLFVTNVGGSAPSYIYRLISELYHPDDFQT